jgi:hypothetical protein
MDILFPRLPCQFLDVQVFDAMGQILKDEHMTLTLFRTDKSGKIIGGFVTALGLQLFLKRPVGLSS